MQEQWTNLLNLFSESAWLVNTFVVVFVSLVARYISKRVFDRLSKQLKKTKNLYDDALLNAARRPVGWLVLVVGISWAADIVGSHSEVEIFQHVGRARELSIVFLVAWFAVGFIKHLEDNFQVSSDKDSRMDIATASAIGKLLRASIAITAFLTVMQTLGFSVSGVLAFGGIGGIAIGFAARDMLANFFGALMIFMDRPFTVGDWIKSPDKKIEGTVEEIGWRLTRIRTFDQRPLYVPNALFTEIVVENPSNMLNRRIRETIGVRYDDVAVLPKILVDIRTMLQAHEAIDQNKTMMVNFNIFGPSSLDFFIYTFTKTVVWTEFHSIKEDILFRISDIISGHGAEIAFPTQTLHVEGAEEQLLGQSTGPVHE
ncbi:MAG: mechanosensitive ion channel family protein [Pseudomonadales bacterium]|nr:mechanosensitive ion channel family protein [Pseudomonadales bacterium]